MLQKSNSLSYKYSKHQEIDISAHLMDFYAIMIKKCLLLELVIFRVMDFYAGRTDFYANSNKKKYFYMFLYLKLLGGKPLYFLYNLEK